MKIKIVGNTNKLIIISFEGFSGRYELENYKISTWINGLNTIFNLQNHEIKENIKDYKNKNFDKTLISLKQFLKKPMPLSPFLFIFVYY